MMQKELPAAKVALVTGAARRIGAQIARTLHAAGMNLVLHFNESGAEAAALCEALNEVRPQSACLLQASLEVSGSAKPLIETAVQHWGRLDVLVNNASRFYPTPIEKVTEDAWDDLMNSNLKAPFFLAKAAAPYLAKHQGSIVNLIDIHAERPLRHYPVYCISKSGLFMMTKVLAKELGPKVRVNGVAPGAILWPEGENTLSNEQKQKIIDHTVLLRPGSAEDIAKAVLFFVRDAEYVTGEVINVDGGRTLFD